MEIVVRPKKMGNSLVIVLPKKLIREEKIKEGIPVRVEIKIIKSAFGIAKGLASLSKEDKFRGQLEDD